MSSAARISSDHAMATLVFADGSTRTFPAAARETVVQAAMRNRLMLLTDCREGACGTCRAICTSGRFALEDYSQSALSAADRDNGGVLMCRMRLQSDCVVEIDYPLANAARGPAPKPRTCAIVAIDRVAADTVELHVRSTDGRPFEFIPGQYVNLAAPDGGSARSYSFASGPDNETATFLIRLVEGGVMSRWLATLARPGMLLTAAGPFGRFFIRDPGRPLLLIAGGTGLAPVLAMLGDIAARGLQPPRVDVVFGVNTQRQLFRTEALDALIRRFDHGSALVTVAAPEAGWAGGVGTTADAIAGIRLLPDTQTYMCGPPAMIEACTARLRDAGLAARDIIFEAFLPSGSEETTA